MKKHTKKAKTLGMTALAALLAVSFSSVAPSFAAEANASGVKKYYTDFETYAEEQEAAYELNKRIAEEGMVLLKNNLKTNISKTLPFGNDVKYLSVFGRGGAGPAYGGSGSGAGQASEYQEQISLTQALESAGFKVNKTLENLYLDSATYSSMEGTLCNDLGYRSAGQAGKSYDKRTDEEVMQDLKDDVKPAESSFNLYNDAALIVLRRDGMEGFDHSYTHYNDDKGSGGGQTRPSVANDEMHVGEDGEADQHSLMLTPEERALVKYVKESGKFDNIVVLINSGNPMEVASLQDDDDIDAIMWIGMPGVSGFEAVGKILNGEVNPSGHLSDIWSADFTKDPTWFNSGYNWQGGDTATADMWYYDISDNTYKKLDAWYTIGDGGSGTGAFQKYEEGVYMGYKWYETASVIDGYYDDSALPDGVTDSYYNRTNGVVYPYGYGLSYTEFEWSDFNIKASSAADGDITLTVKVTNVGSYAGKDVVQVYFNPPYTAGGIQKATANLVTFEKTKTLKPGESQTLSLTFAVKDMASYDYNDANGNGFKGYELEAGNYEISFRKNSHEVVSTLNYSTSGFRYDGSTEALNYNKGYGSTAENIFSNGDIFDSEGPDDVVTYVTRETFALPDFSVADEENGVYTAVFGALTSGSGINGTYVAESTTGYGYNTTDNGATKKALTNALSDNTFGTTITSYLQYLTMFPNDGTVSSSSNDSIDVYGMPWYVSSVPASWTQASSSSSSNRTLTIKLSDLYGKDYQTPTVTLNDSSKTAVATVNLSDDNTKLWEDFMNQLTYDEMVGLLTAQGLEVAGYTQYAAADGPAQLSKGNGTFWACETMIASTFNTELAEEQGIMVGNESLFLGVTGWWGPGANIHRSPFGGRNFEYYSQDGVHSGKMLAAVAKGATSKGVVVNTKHYFLNDVESNRMANDGPAVFCNEQAIREIYVKTFEIAVKEGGLNGFMASYNRVGVVSMDNNYAGLYELPRGEWGFEGIIVSDGGGALNGDFCIRNGLSQGLGGRSSVTVSKDYAWSDDKQGVVSNESGKVSATQWYNVRKAAQNLLYNSINVNGMNNAIDVSSYTDVTLNATKGVSFTQTLGGSVVGATRKTFEIVSGTLPAGLSVSGNQITGTPTETGIFTATIKMACDNYVTALADVTVIVGSPFKTEGKTQLEYGEEVDLTLSVIDEIAKDIPSDATISYTLVGAPEGLSIEDGVIYGTVAAGEYTFTVNYSASYVFQPRPGLNINKSVSYSDEITITVASDPTASVDYRIAAIESDIEEIKNGTAQTDTTLESVKAQIEELKQNGGTDYSDRIAALEKAVKELEKSKASGCNGTVGISGVIGAAVLALFALGVFFVKKTRKAE